MTKTLVVLVGPTGVGKTKLALHIANHIASPILNADSRQIFKEIPIGTAAPTAEQQAIAKHFFVGNHQLTDYYSAALYEQDALLLLDKLFLSHSRVLLSGGSMLYIDAVTKGIDDIPTVDDTTRERMKQRLKDEGLPALVEELKRKDPEHYAIVDRNNPRRVVHALEICEMTGQTYTSFRKNNVKQRPFNILKIGLNRPREELYERINQRVLDMVANGLIDEAKRVFPMRNLNSLNTVGYKELFEHFDGKISLEEAIRRIQSNTRRYMRKQLTWFKRDPEIHWFHPDDEQQILQLIDSQT